MVRKKSVAGKGFRLQSSGGKGKNTPSETRGAAANNAGTTKTIVNSITGSRHNLMSQSSASAIPKNNKFKRTKRIAVGIGGGSDGGVGMCRPDVLIYCFLASLQEGLQHGLSLSYLVDVPGNIYFLIYLLLLRDISWSQYIYDFSYIYVGILAGAAAVFWSVGLLLGAVKFYFYDMAWMSAALVLWTLAEFVWMTAEFYSVDVSPDPNNNIAMMGKIVAQYLLMCALLMMTIFYVILVPFGVFNTNNHLYSPATKYTLKRLDETNPFCPRIWITKFAGNRDFLQYSGIHIFLWTFKDLMWSFGYDRMYILLFTLSCLFLIDLSIRECRQTLQFANIVNTIVMKLWIAANGTWVVGDLERNNDDTIVLTLQEYARGVRSSGGNEERFSSRRIAGWIYITTIVFLVAFYLHWWLKSKQSTQDENNNNGSSTLPPYAEYKKQFKTSTSPAANLAAEDLARAEQASLVNYSGFEGENKVTNNENNNNTIARLLPDEENNIANIDHPFVKKKNKKFSTRSMIQDTTIDTPAEVVISPVLAETNNKEKAKGTTTPEVAEPAKVMLFFPGMTKHDSDKHVVAQVVEEVGDSHDKKTHDLVVYHSDRKINVEDATPLATTTTEAMETLGEDTNVAAAVAVATTTPEEGKI